ncbi:DNA-processing protein DprA [Nitrospina watsonii]|uniref:Smf/DprA SLOG domain-containing protein n=1 Tax=Nitrospina watsonii TaxID=1323948 RepID=A0ABN8VZP5_9BACT|nr:DNA-processing protein DprA [Nitrospina watsonii]CAI2719264.1 conserved protein of unknown function [Nitrospina watsonii]
METNELKFNILRLLETKGIGFAKFWTIWNAFKDDIDLDAIFKGQQEIKKYLNNEGYSDWQSNEKVVSEKWDKLLDKNVQVIFFEDDIYPQKLVSRLKKKAPPILLAFGNLNLLSKTSVGFCGSREASGKGLETAYDCAEQLSRDGINIVSGYAHGVDMTTHRAALESGGTTTLVLAEGILNFKIKKELLSIWDWDRVLVLSEFLPGLPWSVRNAMQRNGVICALSEAVILIEAKSRGGSIEAGKTCLGMNLPLFAPVYEGMPESAVGNRELLNQGAYPIYKSQKTSKANLDKIFHIFDSDSSASSIVPSSKSLKNNQISFLD